MGNTDTDLNPETGLTADHPTLHGGDLLSASRQFGIPVADWIDLSTGISPFAYPFTPPPASAFRRLPYPDPQLYQVAADYYGHANLLVSAGTQPLIQALPCLLPEAPVWVPDIGYREHAQQWAGAGRLCRSYPAHSAQAMISALDMALTADRHSHLVIINPNNPSGVRLQPEQLRTWADRLAPGHYLIIDEAFVDAEPQYSVLPGHWRENMIVLRSFGKFFGLAGLRLGFVAAPTTLRADLSAALGLWSVNGPAQAIACEALADHRWQAQVRTRLQDAADLISGLLTRHIDSPAVHTPLFSTLSLPRAEAEGLQMHCARAGILLRVIHVDDRQSLVRIGRFDPDNEAERRRLEDSLALL
ncbi:aminotransferase class I/II-fold pyridoxal phosphate-dependent enzyme [Natronospirillum operosum]|uniref:Aminotransferase n=1 Tax=Natronospirillum operosum TaxID=2759953 RepID=A0A4Z0WCP3_9GAMM|nr:threonine-phosphate decarboxylase [Natronospirillum operosum]TGG93873.1 aminotransferase class I/II-fold pyridoxal phosphate-dependent enzyme [Natronospirillum operosum]